MATSTAARRARTPARATRTAAAPAKKPAPAAVAAAPAAVAAAPASTPATDLRVVRDGFTMPQSDYDLLKALKAQCLDAGVAVKKSELLRAGVQALAAMPPSNLLDCMRALPAVKSGRKKNRD